MSNKLLLPAFLLTLLLLPLEGSAQTLVHLWAFDQAQGEGISSFADSSGNGQDGMGYADIVEGRFGNAARLFPASFTGGVGDGVDFIDATPEDSPLPITATDSWTINSWALFDETPGGLEYIAGFGIDDEESSGNQRRARSIIHFDETKGFHFWGASVDLPSGVAMPADSQWHMYTVTYDGATTDMAMYYDGVQVASNNFGGAGPFDDAPAEVHVGNPSNWNEEFDGSVDEFGVWDDVLSIEQIGGLFVANDTSQTQFVVPRAVVDRDTGVIQIENVTATAVDNLVGYRVLSAAGSMDDTNWITITGNLDNGQGVDPISDGPWQILPATEFELAEEEQGAGSGSLSVSQVLDLGEVWTKSVHEDVVVELLTDDGGGQQTITALLSYTGDSYMRSDLNANGTLDLGDWEIFTTNGFTNLDGLSDVAKSLSGDLDQDGDNDRQDFLLFKADYIAVNGLAAFGALNSGVVPEPASGVLAALALTLLLKRRRD